MEIELSEAVTIVSQHKADCDRIETGFVPAFTPRHSHTVELYLAIRMLAFEYVRTNKAIAAILISEKL